METTLLKTTLRSRKHHLEKLVTGICVDFFSQPTAQQGSVSPSRIFTQANFDTNKRERVDGVSIGSVWNCVGLRLRLTASLMAHVSVRYHISIFF